MPRPGVLGKSCTPLHPGLRCLLHQRGRCLELGVKGSSYTTIPRVEGFQFEAGDTLTRVRGELVYHCTQVRGGPEWRWETTHTNVSQGAVYYITHGRGGSRLCGGDASNWGVRRISYTTAHRAEVSPPSNWDMPPTKLSSGAPTPPCTGSMGLCPRPRRCLQWSCLVELVLGGRLYNTMPRVKGPPPSTMEMPQTRVSGGALIPPNSGSSGLPP